MSKQPIPEGIIQVASLAGEKPEDIWEGLKKIVDTPERIASLNQAIEKTISELQGSGKTKLEIAEEAMNHAAEAVLDANQSSTSANNIEGSLKQIGNFTLLKKI